MPDDGALHPSGARFCSGALTCSLSLSPLLTKRTVPLVCMGFQHQRGLITMDDRLLSKLLDRVVSHEKFSGKSSCYLNRNIRVAKSVVVSFAGVVRFAPCVTNFLLWFVSFFRRSAFLVAHSVLSALSRALFIQQPLLGTLLSSHQFFLVIDVITGRQRFERQQNQSSYHQYILWSLHE